MKDVPLPEVDGYVALTPGGSIIIPPQDYAKHNCYAVVTIPNCKAYGDARVRAALEAAIEIAGDMDYSVDDAIATAIRRLLP